MHENDTTNAQTTHEQVGDEEVLYRGVKQGQNRVEQRNGKLTPSTDAFLDARYEVSVDRARLRNFDASLSKIASTDYICQLLTRDVRAIETVVRCDDEGSPTSVHAVDVRPDPLLHLSPPNPAHALIYANPQIFPKKDRKLFSRLKEALAQIATWEPNFTPNEPN